MATFDIPTFFGDNTISDYSIEVELDGVEFLLRFKFNGRQGVWYMSILDIDGAPLRSGIAVLNDWPLLLRWSDILVRPAGDFIPISVGEEVSAAGLQQLGGDVLLTYNGES